ncbi:MAG: sulfatase, partial [Bacteroidales bacterium]|nr:sulfatase [Bacteroidales bacterium]
IYTVGTSKRGNKKTRRLVPTPNNTVLGDEFITLAEELKKAGYVTASMGKWHVSDSPLTQGFDVNYAGGKWGHPAGYFAPFKYPTIKAKDGDNLTDLLSSKAIEFIRDNQSHPFFLYLPYYAVHSPLQGKKHLVEKFREKGGNELQHNAIYAAMIATMDSCVGEIIREVDKLKLRDKTLIFFTSDNGGVYNVSRQDPLRGGKGTYYEGGIRVPLIASWPGEIEPGVNTQTQVVNMDYYPTLLDFLNLEPMNTLLDGVSFKNALIGTNGDPEGDNSSIESRPLFFHFPIYLEANRGSAASGRDPVFRTRPGSVIRYGDWKLHWYFEDNGLELYNLATDLGERTNLAEKNPEKTQELLKMLKKWIKETGAPVPVELNVDYDSTFEQNVINKRNF